LRVSPNSTCAFRSIARRFISRRRFSQQLFALTGSSIFICFLSFLRLEDIPFEAHPAAANIQFFTEYSFADAIDNEDPNFASYDGKRQQPDLVILIDNSPPTLIVIEAKMYDTPNKPALIAQMESQEREVLTRLRIWSPSQGLSTLRCCRKRWKSGSAI